MSNSEKTNPGLIILSVLIPLVGYVLYFMKKEENDEVAKQYLWSAVAGSVIGLLFMF